MLRGKIKKVENEVNTVSLAVLFPSRFSEANFYIMDIIQGSQGKRIQPQRWSPFCDPQVNGNDMARKEHPHLEEIESKQGNRDRAHSREFFAFLYLTLCTFQWLGNVRKQWLKDNLNFTCSYAKIGQNPGHFQGYFIIYVNIF